jgi:23S rRNA pseudouridine955/2504/2580 synthase
MPEQRIIAEDDNDIRLDRWFRRHYPQLTHGRLEKLLRKGEVRLDGKRAKSADHVLAGQTLRLPPQVIHDNAPVPEKKAPPTPVKTSRRLEDNILYMDKHLFVLNKPSGLATQGGSGLKEHVDGMLDQLAYEKTVRPKLVHRLDRDTSGVLLIARTAQSAAGLSKALASRDASKVYWALVKGIPEPKRGLIKAALAKEGTRGQNERMTVSEDEDAKFALTEYAVMGQAGTEFAWVAARPVTGRTHQIRVHLASLGTPIVGDFKYGGTDSRTRGDIADKLHLHARSIDIARPDGGRLVVTAPLSPHMEKSWTVLGFNPDDRRDPFASSRPKPKPEAPKKLFAEKPKKKPSGSKGPKKKTAGRQQPRRK